MNSRKDAHSVGVGLVQSARERAYTGIRSAILKGCFEPGAFVEEAQARGAATGQVGRDAGKGSGIGHVPRR